jgi:16S rRNA (guanine527-N7)-methyltransferase
VSDVANALARHGAPPHALERLARYADLLAERNTRMNLTAARDTDAIAGQIADAFSLLPLITDAGELIDIGAGGGLPGIPLAIMTGLRVTLVDATAKKVAFLNETLEALAIDGSAIAARAETLARSAEYRDRFAYATARAVGSLSAVIELTVPFVKIGGRAVLQRGLITDQERRDADTVALALGGEVTEELPASGERRILVVTKRTLTPEDFPRRVGIAQRRPRSSP